MSRTRLAALGLATRYAGTAISLVLALVTTPLILRWLGPTRFGAFRVGQEYLGYLALLEFGLGGVLMVGFARAFAAGDRAETARLFRYGARAYLRLGLLSAAVTVALAAAAPWLVRIADPAERAAVVGELRVGLLLAVVAVAWAPLNPLRYLAEARQRGYLVQLGLILMGVVTAVLAVLSAAAGGGLVGQFAAVVAGNAVLTAFLAAVVLRNGWLSGVRGESGPPPPPPPDRWRMFAFALCGQASVYSDTIIVGLTLGADAVVPFTITQRMLLLVDAQILAVGGTTWAALAELHHRGEADRMNRRLVTLTRVTGILAFGLLVPVAAATPAFVRLWVGPVGYGGVGLVLATAGFACLHGLIALWAWPLMATGHVRRVLPVMAVGAAVNVPVSILATAEFGVIGPALGTLVNYGVVTIWWFPRLLRAAFGTPLGPLARAVVGPALLAVPFAAGLWLLADAFPVDALDAPVWGRWVVLAAGVGAVAAAYLLLAWVLVLPTEDRAELRGRVFRR